jgi:hypothetical protein
VGSEYTYRVIINNIKSISRHSNFLQPGIVEKIPHDKSDLPFPNFLISHAVPTLAPLLSVLLLLLLLPARIDRRGAALQAIGIIPKAR